MLVKLLLGDYKYTDNGIVVGKVMDKLVPTLILFSQGKDGSKLNTIFELKAPCMMSNGDKGKFTGLMITENLYTIPKIVTIANFFAPGTSSPSFTFIVKYNRIRE